MALGVTERFAHHLPAPGNDAVVVLLVLAVPEIQLARNCGLQLETETEKEEEGMREM